MLLPFRGSFIATVLCRCCCWTGHCKWLSPPGSPSILLCHDRNLPIDLTMAVLIDPRQLVMKRILERIHENPQQKLCKKNRHPPAGGHGPCHRQHSKTNTGTFRPMASMEDWETHCLHHQVIHLDSVAQQIYKNHLTPLNPRASVSFSHKCCIKVWDAESSCKLQKDLTGPPKVPECKFE